MLAAFVIFIGQLSLVFFKHITVRALSEGHVLKSVMYTGAIQTSWLVSSSLAIFAMMTSDWLSISAYIVGGMLGSYLNFKVKI